MSRIISQIHARVIRSSSQRGFLQIGHRLVPCLLGKTGLTARKREGDGATPLGRFRLLKAFIRRDRDARALSALPTRALQNSDGWCDASAHPAYNQFVKLPFTASHEKLCRNDEAYDVVIVMDHNIHPRKRGGGSAIFFHLIRQGATHTEGCIAISKTEMRKLLPLLGTRTRILVNHS